MEKAYIAKQEIVDLHDNIIGYELLFRDHEFGIKDFPTNLKATSHVVMNVLTNVDMQKVIPKGKKGFINIDETVLTSGIIDLLDKDIFVLEILETADLNKKVISKISHYHSMGFTIAIDDFDCSPEMLKKFAPIMKYVSIIKIDVIISNPNNLESVITNFKNMNKKILAEKVETQAELIDYKRMGFDLFQGYFISKPETMEISIHKEATHIVLLQLIALLKNDDETIKIERFVKMRPELSFKLIKFINNEHRFEQEIDSITQVLTMMGRDKLMRWLLLYMYSEISTTPISESVLELAQRRAEEMEKEAPHHMKDKAYLAGMFSMMDIMFETNMRELMSHVKMDNDITNLVLTKTGRFSSSLKSIEIKEKQALKKIVCDNFDDINMEDILYALEFGGIKVTKDKL